MEAQKDSPRTWKPIASDDLQRIVTDLIQSHVTSSDPNSKASAIPQELSTALKQLEASNEQVDKIPQEPNYQIMNKTVYMVGAEISLKLFQM